MAAVTAIGPACPGCLGGGEVNGVTCLTCGGSRSVRRPRRRWSVRGAALRVADALAVPAGTAVGWSANLPGIGGAAAVSWGLADVLHSLVHQVPEVGAAAVVAGVFALLLDRQL